MFFAAKPQKKTSIDGLKWSDLVVVGWYVVKKCNVSGVTKGFACNTPQGSRRHVNVHVHADSQYLRKVIQFRINSRSIRGVPWVLLREQLGRSYDGLRGLGGGPPNRLRRGQRLSSFKTPLD